MAWSRFGRLKPAARELLQIAEPLLRAYLARDPLRCQLAHKEKQAPEAVTLLEPSGMPVCALHADEEVAD